MAVINRVVRKPRRTKRKHIWRPSQRHGMTTRLARKVSVCNASIDTVELLENILLHLDAKDLQQAHQVCKTWNATINASLVLQRCLFARAEDSRMTWVLDPLTNALQPYWPGLDDGSVDDAWFNRQGACVPAVLNSNFFSRDPDCVAGLIGIRQRFDRAESLRFNADLKSFAATPAIVDTYLTQPPAKEIVVYLAHRNTQPRKSWTPKYRNESRFRVVNEEGVKWSDLLHAMRNALSTSKDGERVARKVWVDTALSKVWVVGSVFYNAAEYKAIMSGKEAEDAFTAQGASHPKIFSNTGTINAGSRRLSSGIKM